MEKHKIFGVKVIAFILVISFVVSQVNWILTPKKYFDNGWPTTTTYKGFYQMPKDSIDVLFFGSSLGVSNFIPQILYNNYEIKSYNLSCEQQNLLTSYYWLEEALRYQKPKVVILDTYMLFTYNNNEALNTAESCTRMAIDAMKWSTVKWNAVKDITDIDTNQTFNSYLLTNIRFHTRWTELSENDFAYIEREKHYDLKGYAPFNDKLGTPDYKPYSSDSSVSEYCDMVPVMQEYLEKITKLCRENNINIILVKTPTTSWSQEKHNSVQKYANDSQIEFWDFNEEELYDAIGFEFTEDMTDDAHGNIWGAEKISDYIGRRLYNDYCITGGNNQEIWRDSNPYYQAVYEDCGLKYIKYIGDYFDAINSDRYTVFISSLYDVTNLKNYWVTETFDRLGLNFGENLCPNYFAIIEQGSITEKIGTYDLNYVGAINNNLTDISIKAGSASSIIIGNTEYSRAQAGLNIVVYNNERRIVVDSVTYNGGELIR